MQPDPQTHLAPFSEVRHAAVDGGFVVWRRGTGGNMELLNLQVADAHKRKGVGRRLLVEMLRALKDDPPYATVFGFSRTANRVAHDFYGEMGFTLSPVTGVYADGTAVVFSADYTELCKRHLGPCPPEQSS